MPPPVAGDGCRPCPSRHPCRSRGGACGSSPDATSGLIGAGALRQLAEAQRGQGLRFKWIDKPARAREVAGEARTVRVIVAPFRVGGAR
eukprot:1382444-Pyramimonas_sp.AAC.1